MKDPIKLIFKVNCPICGSENSTVIKQIIDIPNFGKTLMISYQCVDCSYKFNDFFNLESRSPKRYILKCEGIEDLSARLIKSGSCTIRIPELEVNIEPGPASEGIITNVEGIIRRVEEIISILEHDERFRENIDKINEKKEIIKSILNGEYEFTIILEDPFGNSKIISERNLIIENLSNDEIAELEKGYLFSIDIKDLKIKDKNNSEENEIQY